MSRLSARQVLPFLGSVLTLVYILYLWKYNEVPADTGDGLAHFDLAHRSWSDATLLLNHWGKPLFTIFSSPFAQGGYQSYLLFNFTVVAAILLLAALIIRKLCVSTWYNFLFALLLLSNYEWMRSVQGGLTEPFFGLLLVSMLLSGIHRKWIVFALIAGFTPFARSEGMLLIPIAAALLVWYGQWKKLYWLAVPFVLFAIAGWALLDDFWWYFNNNPYGHASYGHGSIWHYAESIRSWLSPALFFLIPVSVFGVFILRNRKQYVYERMLFSALLLVFLLIVAAHSWFWYKGTMSSLGLLRLATLAMPSAVLILLICCNSVTRELGTIPKMLALLFFTVFAGKLVYEYERPLKPNPFEKILIIAGKEAAKYPEEVWYYHPMIAWAAGTNNMRQATLSDNLLNKLPNGVYIFRDPQTGPVEHGLPFDLLQRHPEVKLVKTIRAAGEYHVYTNEPCEIRIYRILR